jgi:hypothetical protein
MAFLWKFFLKQTSESNLARGASQPLPSPVSAMIVDSLHTNQRRLRGRFFYSTGREEDCSLHSALVCYSPLPAYQGSSFVSKEEGERGVMKRGAYPTMIWCAAYLPLPGTHVSQGEPTRFACTKQFAAAMIQHAQAPHQQLRLHRIFQCCRCELTFLRMSFTGSSNSSNLKEFELWKPIMYC